jgi:hypothetical protein
MTSSRRERSITVLLNRKKSRNIPVTQKSDRYMTAPAASPSARFMNIMKRMAGYIFPLVILMKMTKMQAIQKLSDVS